MVFLPDFCVATKIELEQKSSFLDRHYLELLQDLSLVYREVPVLEKNPQKSKKGFYQVVDPFLRLWFGAVYPYESFLEFDQTGLVEERLKPLIRLHITHCYEKLCRDYVQYSPGVFGCMRVGRQWGKQYEIDVAGVDIENQLIVAGECKWSKHCVGVSVLQKLEKKITENKLPKAPDCKYLLFSKSGFSDDLQNIADANENIIPIFSKIGIMSPVFYGNCLLTPFH